MSELDRPNRRHRAGGVSAEASGAVEPTAVTVADQGGLVVAMAAESPERTDDTARVVAERDDDLDTPQRLQADFENFHKRTVRERADEAVRAPGEVVAGLLPVLDAFDAALVHHWAAVEPLHGALRAALEWSRWCAPATGWPGGSCARRA